MNLGRAAELADRMRELNALLQAVRGGCRLSFARVYSLTHRRLFGIVLRINHDRGESEEVLQEVYVTVWQRCAQFDASRGEPIHPYLGFAAAEIAQRLDRPIGTVKSWVRRALVSMRSTLDGYR